MNSIVYYFYLDKPIIIKYSNIHKRKLIDIKSFEEFVKSKTTKKSIR